MSREIQNGGFLLSISSLNTGGVAIENVNRHQANRSSVFALSRKKGNARPYIMRALYSNTCGLPKISQDGVKFGKLSKLGTENSS